MPRKPAPAPAPAKSPRKVEPSTDRAILAELRAIRAEQAAQAAQIERHVIAGVRGIALIERHVRTYLEAFVAAGDDDDAGGAPAPSTNGKGPHASG